MDNITANAEQRLAREMLKKYEHQYYPQTLLSLSMKNLRDYLANTPSANLVEEKIEKRGHFHSLSGNQLRQSPSPPAGAG